MRRSGGVGRPKKKIATVRTTIPRDVDDVVTHIMKAQGVSKDEAWALVLKKISLEFDAGLNDEDDDGDDEDDEDDEDEDGGERKRGRDDEEVEGDEDEEDVGSVSDEELRGYMESLSGASEALEEEREVGGEEKLQRVVMSLKAEIARLKRK